MNTSNDIFLLIKSLSRTEKSYFKKFASIHVLGEGNNYVKLFDYIDNMRDYDEKLIRNHFKNEKFTRQISVAKNYLYNAVLRSLKSYRKSTSKRDEVIEMLEDVSILYGKRLFEQAKKILRKCRKICETYEFYSELLQVMVKEIQIVVSEREYDDKTDKIINENYDRRRIILNIIDNMNEYDRLDYNMVSQLTQYTDVNNRTGIKNLEKIISSELLDDESKALSTTARLKYNHIYAAYYYAQGDLQNSYNFLAKEIKLIEAIEDMSDQRFRDYLILQTNLLLLSVELKKFREFEENLKTFREHLADSRVLKNDAIKFYVIQRSSLLEMIYLNTIAGFKRTLEVNAVFSGKLQELGKSLGKSDELTRDNLVSQAYFGEGDYVEALDYLNKIINDRESEARYSSYSHAIIFRLLVHYELGNIDLLEYLIKSAYRYMIKKGKLHRFERIIFNFLRKLPDAVSQGELNEKFNELKDVILRNSDNPSIKDALKYFDFISWLESKTQNRTFGEIIRSKSRPD